MAQKYTPLAQEGTPALGTSGEAVKTLQQQLNTQNANTPGYVPLKIDGLYGPLTQKASTGSTPVGSINGPGAISSSVAGEANHNSAVNGFGAATNPQPLPGTKAIVSSTLNLDGTTTNTLSDGTTQVVGLPKSGITLDATKATADQKIADQEKIDRDNKYLADLQSRKDLINKTADSTLISTVNTITQNAQKLRDATETIRNKEIARAQAYGLAEGGRTVSLQFNDAIDERISDKDKELADLDVQRDSNILKAKLAIEEGRTKDLQSITDNIYKIQDQQRKALDDINKSITDKYKALQDAEKEKDVARKDAITKAAALASTLLGDKYRKAKTDEERQKIILDYMQENALGNMQNAPDAFSAISASVGTKVSDLKKEELDTKSKNATIANTYSTIDERNKKLPLEIKKLNADASKAQAEADALKDDSTDTTAKPVINGLSVTLPDGTVKKFTTQSALDKFKKAANL